MELGRAIQMANSGRNQNGRVVLKPDQWDEKMLL